MNWKYRLFSALCAWFGVCVRKKWRPETINSKRKSKIDLRSSSLWCRINCVYTPNHPNFLPYNLYRLSLHKLNEKPNQNGTKFSEHIQFENMFSCINRGIPWTPVPHIASISCPTLSPSPFRGHTSSSSSSSRRRNYLKSDMHKVLLFHYRLRHICLIPSISPFFFLSRRSDLVLTICIRQAPRHANGFKMCIGFVVCVKLHFHSGCNSVLIFRSFVHSFIQMAFWYRLGWRKGCCDAIANARWLLVLLVQNVRYMEKAIEK